MATLAAAAPPVARLAATLAAMLRPSNPGGARLPGQRDRALRAAETALRTLLVLAENLCKGKVRATAAFAKYTRVRRSNPAMRARLLDRDSVRPSAILVLQALRLQARNAVRESVDDLALLPARLSRQSWVT